MPSGFCPHMIVDSISCCIRTFQLFMVYVRTSIMKGILGCIIFFFIPFHGNAQLFPGLEGEILEIAIRDTYTPAVLLSEADVKDTLYARIFREEDSVRCIYSGLSRFLPEGIDPSQFLFGTGLETESLNLEHGWPQAKGATEGTPAHVNMHHLFPSRSQINTDRANYPFSDIDDVSTEKWYRKETETNQIPSVQIEAYSEFKPGSFEPRESVKGDIARAMFYFWTIYQSEAQAADPDFFEEQRISLCQWHVQDPVDDFEQLRNDRIAVYQGGKLNPFIIDCTLPHRMYCSEFEECEMVKLKNILESKSQILYDRYEHTVSIQGESQEEWNVWVVDIIGQFIHHETLQTNQASQSFEVPSGLFVVLASTKSGHLVQKFYR